MVFGRITPGFDSACNCCGACGTGCCGQGKEQCCDFCNNCFCFGPMCCECCPCGANGCLGYPNHLCGCCGNCNLDWYADCCLPCLIADLFIATDTQNAKAEEWSNIVCTVVTLGILMTVLGAIPEVGSTLSQILEIIEWVYLAVVFGFAATKIAQKKGMVYEPQECCTTCYNGNCVGGCMQCCSSCNCCCAYWCCLPLHMIQVARAIESDSNMQDAIMQGRPQQCQCCNCWKTAKPVQLELTTNGTQVV